MALNAWGIFSNRINQIKGNSFLLLFLQRDFVILMDSQTVKVATQFHPTRGRDNNRINGKGIFIAETNCQLNKKLKFFFLSLIHSFELHKFPSAHTPLQRCQFVWRFLLKSQRLWEGIRNSYEKRFFMKAFKCYGSICDMYFSFVRWLPMAEIQQKQFRWAVWSAMGKREMTKRGRHRSAAVFSSPLCSITYIE